MGLEELEKKRSQASQELHDALNGKEARDADSYEEYCDILHPLYDKVAYWEKKIKDIKPVELKPLSEYGHLMTLQMFIDIVGNGGFIDYDGVGRYVVDNQETNISVSPSEIENGDIRHEFTHVMWFNR